MIRPTIAIVLCTLAALGAPNAQAAVTFKFIRAGDAAKMAFDPARAQEAGDLASNGEFSMALAHRTGSGHIEKHMGWNEELVIQEGSVVLNYGGQGVNARQVSAGEWRADRIVGGKSVLMHPGDIVIIPANTWHQEVLRTPTMRYILFKTRHRN